MAKKRPTTKHSIAHLVEKQVRNRELARAPREAWARPNEQEICDFVSISHSAGLPTGELATRLGETLGWPVFDRQILHEMADSDEYRERIYQYMDERDLGWLEEMVLGMTGEELRPDDYFRFLVETVLSIALRGHAIFVGHATDLILPAGHGLRVRVVAGRAFCAKARAEAYGREVDKAAKELEAMEEKRAQFVQRHFHMDASEETRHDLILNMERFSTNDALALILAALRICGIES